MVKDTCLAAPGNSTRLLRTLAAGNPRITGPRRSRLMHESTNSQSNKTKQTKISMTMS